jgi:hypothetical protein
LLFLPLLPPPDAGLPPPPAFPPLLIGQPPAGLLGQSGQICNTLLFVTLFR